MIEVRDVRTCDEVNAVVRVVSRGTSWLCSAVSAMIRMVVSAPALQKSDVHDAMPADGEPIASPPFDGERAGANGPRSAFTAARLGTLIASSVMHVVCVLKAVGDDAESVVRWVLLTQPSVSALGPRWRASAPLKALRETDCG